MLLTKIVNSPVASNKKIRYVHTVTSFYRQIGAGVSVVNDFERLIFQDAERLMLLKAVIGCAAKQNVSGNLDTAVKTSWWIEEGGTWGDIMPPRIVVAGSGYLTHQKNGIWLGNTYDGLSFDFTAPDGSGLSLHQGDGIILGCEMRRNTPFTILTDCDSWLYCQFGINL